VPIVGTIVQPTCTVATGTVVLSGLPLGSWTINPGSFMGTSTSTTLANLVAGVYNFTATNTAGCTSAATANVVINPQPITPDAPLVGAITQPTYTVATGSVELYGLPTGNWSLNPGAIAGSTSSTIISNLVAGTYSYKVTNTVGCVSAFSSNIVIDPQPTAPSFGPNGSSNHAPLSVDENATAISISVMPNPSNGLFYLSINGLSESTHMSIYSMSGQLIYTDELIDVTDFVNKPIDLKLYPKGMYFIKLVSKDYSHIEKIIIE